MSETLPFESEGPREYVIANASPIDQQAPYQGRIVVVPGSRRAIAFDPRKPGQPHSAVDTNGRPIPGTVIVRDIYEMGPGGVVELRWDAAKALRHILGKDGKTGHYAKMGLFAVEKGRDPRKTPDWSRAVKAYGQSRYVQATRDVAAEMAKRELFRKTGKVPPAQGQHVAAAIEFLETYEPVDAPEKGAFKCLACGTTKMRHRDFVVHAKRVHPDEAAGKLLQVDPELAQEQDPDWDIAERVAKNPAWSRPSIEDAPPAPPAPVAGKNPFDEGKAVTGAPAPVDAFVGDEDEEAELERLTAPGGGA
jgi:hypothetical protein